MCDSENASEVMKVETFMGTVVCFEDSPPHDSVFPQVENNLPGKIYVIIDGQQRVTASLMTAIVLHHELNLAIANLNSSEYKTFVNSVSRKNSVSDLQSHYQCFVELMKDIRDELFGMLLSKEPTGDCRYFPRMIRANIDCWSTNSFRRSNESAIGSLLVSYIDHILEQRDTKFNFKEVDSKEMPIMLVKNIIKNQILENNSYVTTGEDAIDSMPSITKLFGQQQLVQDFFEHFGHYEYTRVMLNGIGDNEDDADKHMSDLDYAAKLVFFAKYMLKKVKIVRMVTTNEIFALNIFDTLNTTGDPLTALETFKLEALQLIDTKSYQKSKHLEIFNEIEECFMFKDPRTQLKKTREMIISFALAESGLKKQISELGEQRQYMKTSYQDAKTNNNDDGLGYLIFLRDLVRVNEEFVQKNQRSKKHIFINNLRRISSEHASGNNTFQITRTHIKLAGEAEYCLKFLNETRHKITIPLIARFYSSFLNSPNEGEYKNLCRVIRSASAFFVIYRTFFGTTSGLDSFHRDIISSQHSNGQVKLNFGRNVPNAGPPDFQLLCEALQEKLLNDTSDSDLSEFKEQYIEKSILFPVYDGKKGNKQIARFLILLSAYWPLYKQNIAVKFDSALWTDVAHETIEHIIPQQTINISNDSEQLTALINTIGNLTLLPGKVNSFLQHTPWSKKRLVYAVLAYDESKGKSLQQYLIDIIGLSEGDLEEYAQVAPKEIFEKLIKPEKNVNELLKIREKLKEMHNGACIPSIEVLAKKPSFVTPDDVMQRGREMLAVAWEPLSEWLSK